MEKEVDVNSHNLSVALVAGFQRFGDQARLDLSKL